MAAEIIDGAQIAAGIRASLAEQTQRMLVDGLLPQLGVLLVGDDPASASYVRGKERAGAETGIGVRIVRIAVEGTGGSGAAGGDGSGGGGAAAGEGSGRGGAAAGEGFGAGGTAAGEGSGEGRAAAGEGFGGGGAAAVEARIGAEIDALNADPDVHGIILQLPLPEGVHVDGLLARISPLKDVDALHPENQGRILQGRERFLPATPHGVQQLLVRSGNDPAGKHVVIVGRSRLVGMPLAAMLAQKRTGANATVTVCHTGTADLAAHTREADIVVAAAGRPGVVTGEMVRPGAVVIDVGVNRVEDASRKRGYRLVGDVDFESVRERAGFITPVPGGVGPMTVAMLLNNVTRATRMAQAARMSRAAGR